MKSAKAKARLALGLLISVFLLWMVLRQVDAQELRRILAATKPSMLLLGLVGVALSFFLRALRWQLMLRHFSKRVTFGATASAFLSGFALNNTLPLRAGDLARTFMFAKELDTSPATLAATLLIERLLDASTLLLVFFLGLSLLDAEKIPAAWVGRIHEAGGLLLALAVVGVLVLMLLPKLLMLLVRRFEHSAKGVKLKHVLIQFGAAFGLLRSPSLFLRLVALSLLSWAAEGGAFVAVASALSIALPSFYAPWFALSMATLATLIPGTPGHLGTFDYFAVTAFSVYGVDKTGAASMALLVHLLLWLPITLVGGTLLLRRQGRGAIERIHQLEEEQV